MLRAFGAFGLAFLFLLISPALRETVIEIVVGVQRKVVDNSPWSYVAIGVATLATLMFCFYRAAQPRC